MQKDTILSSIENFLYIICLIFLWDRKLFRTTLGKIGIIVKMISRDSHPLKSIFQRGRFLSKCLADFFYKPTSLPHVFLKLYTMSNKF